VNAGHDLQLTFLGGASEIGASSTLVQVADTTILVDCGVRFRKGNALPDLDQLTGRRLDAVLVTHAHSDHTGALPVVSEAYPAAPIFMTPPTRDLVKILQRDALRLMDMASEQEGELPLYPKRAVESMLSAVIPIHHGDHVQIGEVSVTYLPASHILGASMIHLATPAGHLLFTGDYCVGGQRTVPNLSSTALPVDWLVTESTYGDRLHAARGAAENRLIAQVARTLAAGGRVLIPAFAIGRAQEVLLILAQAQRQGTLPRVPIFVDGMVRAVCDAYRGRERYVTRPLAHQMRRGNHPFYTDEIQPVRKGLDRKDVLEAGPCVIVASSGMLAGGASAFYAAQIAPCERDAILITGYQDEESPGRALLRLAGGEGPRELRLGDHTVEVRCTFEPYSLSAHADRMQMVGLIEALRPRTVTVVHGDREAKAELAKSLSCPDIVLGSDGAQVRRRFPVRALTRSSQVQAPELTEDAALRLLGEPTSAPLSVPVLARAWFGRKIDSATLERFTERLEATGRVRRDERNPRRLHFIVEAGETRPADASGDDRELVEKLKAQNPKGRLLELCARLQCSPEIQVEPLADQRHRVFMTLDYQGKRLTSGPQEAASKRVAEHLAARALLDALRKEGKPQATMIDGPRAAALRQENPKGQLLEYCAQHKLGAPKFETTPIVGGIIGSVTVEGLGESPWRSSAYRAAAAIIVEHAACAELLERIRTEKPKPVVSAPPSGTSLESRMRLNELRQTGSIRDFGYEESPPQGPLHQRIFEVRAWAELVTGERCQSAPAQASSKRDAQRDAAAALISTLATRGVH
jgi:Cft2 family RNA processing exonuclease/dsRNA-specific ribonuclease